MNNKKPVYRSRRSSRLNGKNKPPSVGGSIDGQKKRRRETNNSNPVGQPASKRFRSKEARQQKNDVDRPMRTAQVQESACTEETRSTDIRGAYDPQQNRRNGQTGMNETRNHTEDHGTPNANVIESEGVDNNVASDESERIQNANIIGNESIDNNAAEDGSETDESPRVERDRPADAAARPGHNDMVERGDDQAGGITNDNASPKVVKRLSFGGPDLGEAVASNSRVLVEGTVHETFEFTQSGHEEVRTVGRVEQLCQSTPNGDEAMEGTSKSPKVHKRVESSPAGKNCTENEVVKRYHEMMKKRLSGFEGIATAQNTYSGVMSSIVPVINSVTDRTEITLSSFVDVLGLLCNSIKATECNGLKIPGNTKELYKVFRKKALKNVIVHLSKGYIPTDVKRNGGQQGDRPIPNWADCIRINDEIISEVCKEEETYGKKKLNVKKLEKFVKDYCRKVSADEDTKFVLTFLYRTITKALNCNRKCMKRSFSRMIGYCFVEWTIHGFDELEKDVKGVWAVPYAKGVMLRPESVPGTDTVRLCEDADAKNAQKFNAFVIERKEMMIYFEHDVYVVETKSGRKAKSSPRLENICRGASPGSPLSNVKRIFRRMVSLIEVAVVLLCEWSGAGGQVEPVSVLKFHSRSLSAVYVLALALRAMVHASSVDLMVRDPAQCDYDDDIAGYDEEDVFRSADIPEDESAVKDLYTCLKCLMAPRSDMKPIIESVVTRVKLADWNRFNCPVEHENVRTGDCEGEEPNSNDFSDTVNVREMEGDM